MSGAGAAGRVVALLESEGYETVEEPQVIGGFPFEFAGMLARSDSLDLVVLVDLAVDADDGRIQRRVTALAQALDLVRSRRSLTAILAGPRRQDLIRKLSGMCRLLSVSDSEEGAELRRSVAVLLPLEVIPGEDGVSDPWAQAAERMRGSDPAEVGPLLEAAAGGAPAVRSALGDLLGAPIEGFDDDGDEREG